VSDTGPHRVRPWEPMSILACCGGRQPPTWRDGS